MPGPSCERVARCREKSRRRRFAVSQGFLRRPVFATTGASSSLPSHPFQPSHVLPAAQVSVPHTTRKRSLMDFPIEIARVNRRRRLTRLNCSRSSAVPPLDRPSIDELKDSYKERSYYGGPSHECPYCGAFFWFQERAETLSLVSKRKIVYNPCCRGARINLKPYAKPPAPLAELLRFDGDSRSRKFLRQIRSYNSMFAFTSIGASVDKTLNNGTAPYVFKINGVVHHRIGSLLPKSGTRPKFAQLYIYDTEHESSNRLGLFQADDLASNQLDPSIVQELLDMLNEHNSLVKAFRLARERLEQAGDQRVTLRLLGCNSRHDVQYNLPTSGEIAAIIVGDYSADEYTYDVLVHDRGHGLKRVSCLHPSYLALQYPLLFPYGENGFHLGIKYSDADDAGLTRKYVTMLEFGRFHMHYRLNEANPFTCYGDLYKCTNPGCAAVGMPTQRYKLSLLAGDETGDTNFIIFGRIAQRLTKKAADTLVADNLVGFVPDEITRLLEWTYIWNVSFTDSTIETGNITFQVNAIVAEISDVTTVLPVTPTQSQTSSLMLSRGAAPGMEDTPQSSNPLALSQMPMTSETSLASSATPTKMGLPTADLMGTPQGGKDAAVDEADTLTSAAGLPDKSSAKKHMTTTGKRTRQSPNKKIAKELFVDEQAENQTAEDGVVVPAATKTRARRSPSNKIAKGLSPEELAGESVGDSGGSAAAAAAGDSPGTDA